LPRADDIQVLADEPPATEASQSPQPGLEMRVVGLETRLRRSKVRARRQYLDWVDRALLIHYVTPFVYLVGVALGIVALNLAWSARTFQWEEAGDVAWFFFSVGGVVVLLAALLALLASVFALLGRPRKSRASLLGSLGLFGAGCGFAALMIFLPGFGPLWFPAAVMILFGGWACWLVFLGALGATLKRPEVAEGAMQTIWSGFKAMGLAVLFWLVIGVAVALMLKKPVCLFFVPVSAVAALVAVVFRAGSFDSVTGFLLAPTGILFALDCLNFSSGLRLLIERRS
jgi:hypothetical protein